MTLSPGLRLGPYEIVAPLGAGGMGEVYRAKDTRLGREVAIKVLPAEFASDPERLKRFELEARAASALNHPNILTLFDLGEHDGKPFLVLELLEGRVLREVLASGETIATKKALDWGVQVARGLAAAHDKGIVHRDLKPENLFLCSDGRVKILDFGLAKLTLSDEGTLATAATIAGGATASGIILGTAGYMAPEQVRGARVDHRADLFALGSVLHELLTGERAFHGATAIETLNAILKEEPPELSRRRADAPPQLDRIVRHCLEKNPDDRLQSARDLAVQLGWLLEGSGPASALRAAATADRSSRLPWWIATAAAAVAVGAIAALVVLARSPTQRPATRAPIRFEVGPPKGWTFSLSGRDAGPVAVSPDGRQLAFVAAERDGRKLLFVRPLSELESKPLAGTDGASYPFWSADSRFLAFFADEKLKKIEATGGPIQVLCAAPLGRGGSWNRSGAIVFAPTSESPLYQVADSGGAATPVTRLDPSTTFSSHRWPHFLPDGRHFLYQAFSFVLSGPEGGHALFLGSLDGDEARLLLRADSKAELSRGGHLLFARDRTLLAAKFDPDRLALAPGTVPLAQALQQFSNTASTIFSVSGGDVLAYQTGSMAPSSQLIWFDRAGNELGTLGPRSETEDPRISPDGRTVAVNLIDPETGISNIWLYALPGGAASRFTFAASFEHSPIWSPDGSRIAFDSFRSHPIAIYIKPRDGAEEERVIAAPEPFKAPTDWSPDGRLLLFQVLDPSSGWDLWSWSVGAAEPVPLLQTPTHELDGQLSADGRWIAYASDETGSWEVYVAAFPGPGGKRQVSRGGGTQPIWRRDGSELFYLAPDRRLMAVPVGGGAQLTLGAPQPLFQTRARNTGNRSYDVSPDGERFLISTIVVEPSFDPITVVLNWEAGLEER